MEKKLWIDGNSISRQKGLSMHPENLTATISDIPIDCLLIIFSYLPISKRFSIERVSKLWKEISQSGWIGFQTLHFKKTLWGFPEKTKVKVTDEILQKVLLRCGKYLRKIQFPQSERDLHSMNLLLTQKFFGNILEMCPQLKILDFGVQYVKSSVIGVVPNSSFQMEILCLDINGSMTDDEFSTIYASEKKLKIIHLFHGDSAKTCTCLQNLNTNAIQEVEIRSNNLYHDPKMGFINQPKVQELRKVSIHNMSHRNFAWSLNACAENFTSLDFFGFRILHDASILNLQSLANLKELYLFGDFEKADEGELFFKAASNNCRNLVKLVIRGCHSLNENGLSAIGLYLNLKHLELIDIDNIRGKNLENMQSLQYFKSKNCGKIEEDHFAEMLLSAAKHSRTFELTISYLGSPYTEKLPIFSQKIMQMVATIRNQFKNAFSITTKSHFQYDAQTQSEEQNISIFLDCQRKVSRYAQLRFKK